MSVTHLKGFLILFGLFVYIRMTGFQSIDVIGRNCRFLQAPDAHIVKGEDRQYTDNTVVKLMKESIMALEECQYTLVNYKKNGEPFMNLITMIPMYIACSCL